ncbi:acyltransferase [Alsobacter sp. SYSU M60028]|uniref:Acyltransferase n=1 Tax=Alsobacter ponti TaxID=2962936 RepID=A0ABT1L7Y5_9HYPH|nr:acyltransferase [Alsobacter ponti]MCP8937604.1 acyltransferase [Alsobacter ponti]
MQGSRVAAFDGWRAVCILMVILGHLAEYSSVRGDGPLESVISAYALLRVQIFFVLCGYLTGCSLQREGRRGGRVHVMRFYVRRFMRVVPPLLVFVAAIVLMARQGLIDPEAVGVYRAIFYVCNVRDCGGYVGGHLWTLSAQEQFYILAPFLFIFYRIAPSRTTLALATFPLFVAAWVLATRSPLSLVALQFVPLAVGLLCAFYRDDLWRRCAEAPASSLAVAALLILVIYPAEGPLAVVARAVLVPGLIAFMLAKSATVAPVNRFLSARPVAVIGRASYSIYLWQQLATYPFEGAGYAFYIGSLGLCIFAGVLSYALFERGLARLSDRAQAWLGEPGPVFGWRPRATAAALPAREQAH